MRDRKAAAPRIAAAIAALALLACSLGAAVAPPQDTTGDAGALPAPSVPAETVTPEATAMAIESGSATMATVSPAITSLRKVERP